MKMSKHYLLKFAMPVFAAVAMMFTSCSSCSSDKDSESSDSAELLVPKNAYCVANVNLGTLWSKGGLSNFESLKTYSMFRDEIESIPSEKYKNLIYSLMRDPSTSGINTDKDILAFASREGDALMIGVTASIKNKGDFNEFMASLQDVTGFKPKSGKGFDYIKLDKEVLLTYNDQNIALVVATDRKGRDLMEKYAASLFSMDNSGSILSNSNFNEYWNNHKEIGFYVALDNLFGDEKIAASATHEMKREMRRNAGISEEDFDKAFDMLKKASCYYTLAFENGSIDMQCKVLGAPSDLDAMGDGISTTLMRFMPENTLAAASISLNLSKLVNKLEENVEVSRALDERIEGSPYTVRDIVNTFGGNVVASFYGMSYDGKPLFAVAADLNDRSLVSNLVSAISIDSYRNVYLINNDIPLYLYFDDNTVALTDDAGAAERYTTGGYSDGLGNIADNAQKGNYIYLDLKLRDYPSTLLDRIGYRYNPGLDQILSLFDNIEIIANKDNSASIRINFTDNRNSLDAMVRTLDNLISNGLFFGGNVEYSNYDYPAADTVMYY